MPGAPLKRVWSRRPCQIHGLARCRTELNGGAVQQEQAPAPCYVNSDVTMVVNLVYPRRRYPTGGVVLPSAPDVMVADRLMADALHQAYFPVSPTKHSFYHSRED